MVLKKFFLPRITDTIPSNNNSIANKIIKCVSLVNTENLVSPLCTTRKALLKLQTNKEITPEIKPKMPESLKNVLVEDGICSSFRNLIEHFIPPIVNKITQGN